MQQQQQPQQLQNSQLDNSQVQQPYNWLGVLEFLQDQFKEQTFKETEWLLKEQELKDKNAQQEAEIKAHEKINQDLMKRVQMLEYALRAERMQYQQQLKGKQIDSAYTKALQENNQLLQNSEENLPKIPKRRAQGHRPLLSKILEEVGLEDIFKSNEYKIQEQQEFKNILEAQQENMEPKIVTETKKENQQNMIENQLKLLQETENQIESQIEKQENQNQKSNGKSQNFLQKTKQQDENQVKQIKDNDSSQKQSDSQVLSPNNNNLNNSQNQQQQQQNLNQNTLKQQFEIRAHLDAVNDCTFLQDKIFVTVSEDCSVKLWNLQQFQNSINKEQNMDPYYTLREHFGPLFTITSCPDTIEESSFNFFTAGSEGIIKCWNGLLPEEVNNFEESEKYNFCIGSWQCHEDVIWQLVHHPYSQEMLSSSADKRIKSWGYSTSQGSEQENTDLECIGQFLQEFVYSGDIQNDYDVPTSIDYIYSNLQFIAAGYQSHNHIVLFNKFQGNINQVIKYDADNIAQVNKLVSHEKLSTLISGHDDGIIRFFDLNSNSQIGQIKGSEGYIQSINISKQNQNHLFSVGQDGKVKVWDIRNYQCIQEDIQDVHLQKYDKSLHNIQTSGKTQYVATCGADGNVGVFKYN